VTVSRRTKRTIQPLFEPARTGVHIHGWCGACQHRSSTDQTWQTRPGLVRLHRALELVRRRTLPQGLLGQAIDYALKRWSALTQFMEDGALEIHDNSTGNAIRPRALGKRNSLFIGHLETGERIALFCNLLGSCRRHGLNPFECLEDWFTCLPVG
jgi:hypothetical protein